MTNESEQSLSALLAAYQAAVRAKDVDALAALYDSDVCVFDMWNAWSCEGIAAWRKLIAQWFGSMGENRDLVEFDQVRMFGERDVATVHAFITFRCVNLEGKELRSMQERLSWSLLRKREAWKIVHQHTSAPVDGKTFTVIFQK